MTQKEFLDYLRRTDKPSFNYVDTNTVAADALKRLAMAMNSYYGVTKSSSTMEIKNVIFNDPATIVIWEDGTKTVVKCGDGDIFDPEKGLAMAIAKRLYGDKGNYYKLFKKWLPEEYDKVSDNEIDNLRKKLEDATKRYNRLLENSRILSDAVSEKGYTAKEIADAFNVRESYIKNKMENYEESRYNGTH